MAELTRHWTEGDVESFMYRIGSDFVRQLQQRMESGPGISQAELAGRLNVSEGRVSQILNNPGNLTLRKIVEYSRILGLKVSVVAYDDRDPTNKNGPINSEIFAACWEESGRPVDFFALRESQQLAQRHQAAYFAASVNVYGTTITCALGSGVTNNLGRMLNVGPGPNVTLIQIASTADGPAFNVVPAGVLAAAVPARQ